MIKQFTRFEIAAIKRTLKNISPLIRKRGTLEKHADQILTELKKVDEQINAYKQMLDPITGGIDPEIIIAQEGRVEISKQPEIPADEGVNMDPTQEVTEEGEMPFQE